jgi:hypothetical protein
LEPLGNQKARLIVASPQPEDKRTADKKTAQAPGKSAQAPAVARGGECKKYFAAVGAVLTVPCS